MHYKTPSYQCTDIHDKQGGIMLIMGIPIHGKTVVI